jgi:protein phosphatase
MDWRTPPSQLRISRYRIILWEIFVATAVAHYTAAALTDRGRRRGSNEDAFGYSVEHGVYLVCDGMGGAAAGEIASSLAVDEVLRLVTERLETPAESVSNSLPDLAQEAIVAANHAIHSRGQRSLRLSGMGTTLVGLLAGQPDSGRDSNPRAWILNVGDSRCYRLRKARLQLCTQDHSLVEEQIRLGRMTRSEAARSPLRNVITRALGTQSSVTPDVIEAEVEPGDLFLLCSDGLTRELSDERIESILNAGRNAGRNAGKGALNPTSESSAAQLEELCARLVQAANKAGGHDNITCLLVRVD